MAIMQDMEVVEHFAQHVELYVSSVGKNYPTGTVYHFPVERMEVGHVQQ